MHSMMAYINSIRRARDIFFTGSLVNQKYCNFTSFDGDKNWASYDRFTLGYSALQLPYVHNVELEGKDLLPNISQDVVKKLLCGFLLWQYACSQTLRHFPSRVLRNAELLHGIMSYHSERLRLSVFLLQLFAKISDWESLPPFQRMQAEAWFLLPGRQSLPTIYLAQLLLQQIQIEKRIAEVLLEVVVTKEPRSLIHQWRLHLQLQQGFFADQIDKVMLLSPEDMPEVLTCRLPPLHYLGYLPEFNSMLQGLTSLEAEIAKEPRTLELPGPVISYQTQAEVAQEIKLMPRAISQWVMECRESMENQPLPAEAENDELLTRLCTEIRRRAYSELTTPVSLKHQYETDVYYEYSKEMQKIFWSCNDVHALLDKNPLTTVTDNDYQLLDVVKEIAYCEGFSYTIGYQNMFHVGDLHDFQLWNVNQCHEELKHYHAIRLLLNRSRVLNEHMDEDFLASTFEEPSIDAYGEKYSVFMINFLGETHNMRAYWLLAQAFDSPQIKQILEWIFYDEVIHKKIFAMHFKKMCQKERDWEQNTYENLMDHALGVHQAMRCSRYHVLMQKIGRYYATSGKTTALDFLNKSLKAQYLELKDLFDPKVFRLREYDFRKRHLNAYLV